MKRQNKTFTAKKRIKTTIDTLASWGELAHGDPEFEKRFCKGKCWIPCDVSWDSENMRVHYIIDSGQHVGDSFKMGEWMEFLSNYDYGHGYKGVY